VDYYELIFNEVPIRLYSKSTPSALEYHNETNKKRGGTHKTKQNHYTLYTWYLSSIEFGSTILCKNK